MCVCLVDSGHNVISKIIPWVEGNVGSLYEQLALKITLGNHRVQHKPNVIKFNPILIKAHIWNPSWGWQRPQSNSAHLKCSQGRLPFTSLSH